MLYADNSLAYFVKPLTLLSLLIVDSQFYLEAPFTIL